MSGWRATWYRSRCLLRSGSGAAFATIALAAMVSALVLTLTAGARRTLTAPDRYLSTLGADWDLNVEQESGAPDRAVASLPAVEDAATVTFVFGGIVP